MENKKSITFEVRSVVEDIEMVEKKTEHFAKFIENYNLQNSNEKDFDANQFIIDAIDCLVKKHGFITPYQLAEVGNTAMDLAVEIERTIRREEEDKANENKNGVA